MDTVGRKAHISKKLINMAAMSKTPISAGFELTARCTLRCKMCYIVSGNFKPCADEELTAQQWIDLARQAAEQGLLYLQLTGGEAMMRSDFKEIYQALHKMGLKISVSTNATLFNDEYIEFFKNYPPVRFSISLYGSDNETYEELCGLKNGYDIVTCNIDKLIAAGLNVKINLTLTKYNVKDAKGICEFAKSRGLMVTQMSYTFPPEQTSDYGVDDTRLCAEDAAKVYLQCESIMFPNERFAEKISALSKRSLADEDAGGLEFRRNGNKLKCQAARSSYWINWRGEMLPCVEMPFIKAYPLQVGFKQAWDEIVQKTDEIVRFPDECTTCNMRDVCFACPAYFYAETGRPDVLAPNICKYIENYIKYAREIEKGKSIDEI
ncbi:MAG: radical SAM protein [Clostridia bacterium]|nr:radical SAM protein [Clostridia bacterium]